MYNNSYSNINSQLTQVQQQQQQQYLLNEFLKTKEGQLAHNIFVEAQTKWWNEVNGIVPKGNNTSENVKINELENKLDMLTNSVTSLVEQLNKDKED